MQALMALELATAAIQVVALALAPPLLLKGAQCPSRAVKCFLSKAIELDAKVHSSCVCGARKQQETHLWWHVWHAGFFVDSRGKPTRTTGYRIQWSAIPTQLAPSECT